MREVTFSEYLEYIEKHGEIVLEDQVINLKSIEVNRLIPSRDELTDISTTVWSFPKRGSWATHRGDYRGNWAPQIPRALILTYTREGDTVLDSMVGSGTTCIEAKLLGRNCIGVDINYNAVILTLHRLYYLEKALKERRLLLDHVELNQAVENWIKIYHGDSRKLHLIESESVDFIATHPPYLNIVNYAPREYIEGDLSRAKNLEEYLEWIYEVSRELYRVLKPGKYLAILIGDTRIHKHYVPISHYVLDVFLKTGFILKEEIIKIQHKMKTTREIWSKLRNRDFLLIYHEKLFVFRKPGKNEDISKYKYSTLFSK